MMATRVEDRSAALELLADTGTALDTSRGDEFIHPDQPSSWPGARNRHPRDVRVIPKSRDFH
jgi:error-prone DNA polymerase